MRRTHAVAAAVVCLVGTAASDLVTAAPAAAAPGTWVQKLNAFRASVGAAPLAEDPQASHVAQAWTNHMALTRTLAHNASTGRQVAAAWSVIGENVGVGGSEDHLVQMFLASAPHRANLADGRYTHVGVGEARTADGRLWTTHVFYAAATSSTAGGAVAPSPVAAAAAPAAGAPRATRLIRKRRCTTYVRRGRTRRTCRTTRIRIVL